MEKSKNITSITTILLLAFSLLASSTLLAALLAVGLPASVAEAKPASVLLQEGLYAEEIEGDLDAASKIYEQIAADKSVDSRYAAQAMYRLGVCYQKKHDHQKAKATFEKLIARFPKQKAIIEKVQPLLAQMSTQNPAALMPPETLVYLEIGSPGKQIETILNMLKGTPFANPLAAISTGQKSRDGKSPGDILAALMNPSMMAEFKKIRGMAIGFQGVSDNNPPLVAVLYPGESDALRGMIIAGLGIALQPGEAIGGMQTLRMGEIGGVAYDDNVIILALPIKRLVWCVKQYEGITNEPTLASQNKAFQKLSRKVREQNAVTIWADVNKVFPSIKEGMPDEQRLLIEGIGDIGNVDDFTVCLSIEESGLAVETNIGFKDGHNCLAYNLIRTPNLTKAGFEAVPPQAVALVSFALGESEGAGVAGARKAVKKLTGLDIGRELFANIEQITLFALPPSPASSEHILAESISPIVPCLGLAVTSHNPQKTHRLFMQLLTMADMIRSMNEESEEHISPTPGKYKIGEFDDKPAYCYVGQAGKSTILTLSPEVLQASLSSLKSGKSALSAGPLQEVLSQLPPDAGKLAVVNAGGAMRLADTHICKSLGVRADPNKNSLSRLLEQLAQNCDKTNVLVHTGEKPNNFHLKVSINNLPQLGPLFPLLAQIPRAMENPMLAATSPRPDDKTMVRPTAAVELNWAPGGGATTHKVYFGTNIDKLSLLGEVKIPNFDRLPTPERGVTYYWRVDEVQGDGPVVTGNIWSFSTGKLVARWKFDEGEATTAYDSVGNNNGTIYGAQWTTGIIDGALDFDGIDDYVDLGNNSSLKPPLPVTLSAWIRFSQNNATLISLDELSSKYYGVWLNINLENHLTVGFGDGNGQGAARYRRSKAGTTALNADTWYHAAVVVRDAKNMSIYINGVDDGGSYSGTGGSLAYSSGNASIGTAHFENKYFNGKLDELRIYNYALSQEETVELCATTVATLPQPGNRAFVKPGADVQLSWRPGKDATAHKVYFGTSIDKLSFLAEAKPPSYDKLPAPERGVTYYWRIDEVQANGSVVTGDIWSFSTGKLVAWWKFDETSGTTAADSSGNGYDGKVTDAEWTTGHIGGALNFNGEDYVSVPKDVFLSISKQITIAFWQYGDSAKQPQKDSIFEGRNSADERLLNLHLPWYNELVHWDAGLVKNVPYHSGKYKMVRISKQASPDEYEGRWNHWAVTKNADTGEMKMYLNGRLWHHGSGKTKTIEGVTTFNIGSYAGATGSFYAGLIDDFRIYNYALSAEEIQQICSTAPVFGPVIERVIYDPASSRECFIDFESGEIFKIPEPLRGPNISQARAIEWLTATGVDAQGDTGGSPRSHGLVGFPPYNAAAVEVPGGWNATPETLIAMTRQLTAGGKSKMFAKDPLPTTYYFKTRQGNMGVLQILGFTEGEPRGVRFRYKMVQEKAAPVVQAGTAPVDYPESFTKLQALGRAVVMFTNDNNGKMPATLRELKPYLDDDFKWLIENVRYFGKGQEREEPDTPIAYDKTLLEKGNGTNVLFKDGHVGFLTPEELERLGIITGKKTQAILG